MFLLLAACVFLAINLATIHSSAPCNSTVVLTSNFTNVTSPNYPNSYPDNLDCCWTFRASDSNNQVVVSMADSYIDPSPNCSKSSLTFYDGGNSTAKPLNRYCAGDKVAMASSGDALFVEFKTGPGNQGRGFRLVAFEIPRCGGNLTATSDKKSLKSPYYPIQYFSNLHCTWNIRTEYANQTIYVEVLDSRIEPSFGCRYDSVTVFNGNNISASTELGVFCGDNQPIYQSSSTQLLIVFKTDESLEMKGFKLQYQAVPESSCLMTVIAYENVSSYIVSPGYPHSYYNNLHCHWSIVTLAEKIELDVVTADIEGPSPACGNDNVTVYQDLPSPDTKLGEFCDTTSNSTFFVARTVMDIVFKTNAVIVKPGFKLRYKAFNGMGPTTTPAPPLPCGKTSFTVSQTTVNHFLTSPGYPSGYRANENCSYTITGPQNTMIHVRVTDSSLADSVYCDGDYVHAYDGTSVSAKSLTVWCGSQRPEFQSTGHQVTLLFATNTDRHKGFNLTYFATTQPYKCSSNLVASKSKKYFTSRNYPNQYQNNADCTWIITTPERNMQLKVVDSNIEFAWNCSADYVTVLEVSPEGIHPLSRFCNMAPQTITSAGQKVQVTFHTNAIASFRGFNISYQGGQFSLCGERQLIAEFYQTHYIYSPNYPYNYPSNTDCVWTIQTTDSLYSVYLNVKYSSIQYSSGCVSDYVEMFDGPDTTSRSLGRFCGTQTPSHYSTGQYMTIQFHSDGSKNDKGFQLEYDSFLTSDTHDWNVGGIAGGSVGGVVFLLCAVFVFIYWRRRLLNRPPVTRLVEEK